MFGAVVLDVVSIGVNSALASSKTVTSVAVFWLFMVGVMVVTTVAAAALRNGTKACISFHEALMALYSREGVAEFFPKEGLRRGVSRYHLYLGLVLMLGGLAVVVPLLVKFGA